MSKKVLILVIGCALDPWAKMWQTSCETWNSIEVDGVETISYWGQPVKENTDKEIYFDIRESYDTMGHKLLSSFDWCLKNKEFDFIARVNGSCYVDKRELIKHVQTLPDNNLFSGAIVPAGEQYKFPWIWGAMSFVISKDIVKKLLDHRDKFNHNLIEDVALSKLAYDLNIPFTDGVGCSIDRDGDRYRSIGYKKESYVFSDFSEFKKQGSPFYRVKIDLDRSQDEYLMRELFRRLH